MNAGMLHSPVQSEGPYGSNADVNNSKSKRKVDPACDSRVLMQKHKGAVLSPNN